MRIERKEMFNLILYQIGALSAFLKLAGMPLSHIKPHGALYAMAAQQTEIAEAVADAAELYGVPVMGLAGTLHEDVYTARGIGFLAEFFADLDYNDAGSLIVAREHVALEPTVAAARALQAVRDGTLTTIGGKIVPTRAETICVHSDTPDAAAIAQAVRKVLAGA